jgi:hypothetical protein
MSKPWMLDELAHAGPKHLDPDFVVGFDRKEGYPDSAADLAALRERGIGPASTVVDLGAGTGQFDFAPAQAEAIVDGWLDSAAKDPETGYIRDDLGEHLRTEFSTFRWLLEPMLAAAGFSIATPTSRTRSTAPTPASRPDGGRPQGRPPCDAVTGS